MTARILGLLLMSLALAGCMEQDMSDLQRFVAQVKARKEGYIEPLPEIKQVETFSYEAGNRRDPFRPVQDEPRATRAQVDNGIAPDPNRRKEELEAFPLDTLRMVGTLERGGVMWALISSKENTIYRVKVGNYMGQNHGQITRIDETGIELTEIVPDGQGGYRERQASLTLEGQDQG